MKPLIICLVLIACQPRGGEASTISAPFVTVGVGDTVVIPISIADAVDLTSWQFDMNFAPAIVRADSVDEGPFMSAVGTTLFIPGVIDDVGGSITLVSDFYVDLPPNPSGSGVLANIQFRALAPGVSPLHFSNVFLNLLDSGFQIADGQITVTGPSGGPGGPSPVPEPATLVLVAGGGALLARRRLTRYVLLSSTTSDQSAFQNEDGREGGAVVLGHVGDAAIPH